ncbi:MAG: four helix bundle protein [Candidatus Aminicenantes bacterium]|nr:four helix bundle protein [Candidatus Aminicenantes bacterium]
MKSYKELIVWQKAYQLTLLVYKETEKFPKSEIFGLSSQLRRAAVSIASNIAEGYQRQHGGEYVQFLSIAFGSCAEVETQLLLCKDLCYLSESNFFILNNLLTEVGKMLYALIAKIKEQIARRDFGKKQ